MKAIYLLIICSLAFACDEEGRDPLYPDNKLGCQYTNGLGKDPREFVRCCTYKEFMAWGDVSKGGVSSWTKNHTWIAVDDCAQCQ